MLILDVGYWVEVLVVVSMLGHLLLFRLDNIVHIVSYIDPCLGHHLNISIRIIMVVLLI